MTSIFNELESKGYSYDKKLLPFLSGPSEIFVSTDTIDFPLTKITDNLNLPQPEFEQQKHKKY